MTIREVTVDAWVTETEEGVLFYKARVIGYSDNVISESGPCRSMFALSNSLRLYRIKAVRAALDRVSGAKASRYTREFASWLSWVHGALLR